MLQPGPVPKYYQLAELLRQQITSGLLKSNEQLPTEDALSRQHQVSRGTVREAIRSLIAAGLIRREQGRGTFVNSPRPASTLFTLTSFNAEMRRQNRYPTTQVLTAEVIPASAAVAAQLALAEAAPVIHLVRLRLANNQPVIYETRFLAQELCPTLLNEDLINSSIHHLLVQKHQIPLVKMAHTVEIRPLSGQNAHRLAAHEGETAFFVDRLTYTHQGARQIPAVWFQAIYREHSYNLQAQVQAEDVLEPSL